MLSLVRDSSPCFPGSMTRGKSMSAPVRAVIGENPDPITAPQVTNKAMDRTVNQDSFRAVMQFSVFYVTFLPRH